jgi:diacylglycerol kinase family enzyme
VTRALLITNPAAARTEALAVRAVVDTLRAGGWSVDVLATMRAGDARRFAEEARRQGYDVVVCYGGDGTAMQITAGLLGSGIPLGLVPGGTGNLLAGNLRLPRNPVAAARAMLKAGTRPVDLGVVERSDGPHYFAVAAGAGFDAELMARTRAAEKHRWKFGAYVVRALEMLPRVTSVPHRVTVDGRVHETPCAMVLVASCPELAPPLLRLRADAAPDDGELDVVALKADGVFDSLGAFWDLLRGSLGGGDAGGAGRRRGWGNGARRAKRGANGSATGRVWFDRGTTVRVEVLEGEPRPVQLDGEASGATPFEVRVLPGALPVLAGARGRA